jgi:hypothetical protein
MRLFLAPVETLEYHIVLPSLDVYSFGVVLYEMMCDEQFVPKSVTKALGRIKNDLFAQAKDEHIDALRNLLGVMLSSGQTRPTALWILEVRNTWSRTVLFDAALSP